MPVVNLPGIKPGQMVLDGPALAKIYLGQINKWNDPAIKKLNPKLNLPCDANPVGASLRRIGHDVQFHQLSRQGEPGMAEQGRRGHRRRLARRGRRQGQ